VDFYYYFFCLFAGVFFNKKYSFINRILVALADRSNHKHPRNIDGRRGAAGVA
jgi:hypothetical protein